MAKDLRADTDDRILIVDDEKFVRDVFAEHLSGRYECVIAADAQEALA